MADEYVKAALVRHDCEAAAQDMLFDARSLSIKRRVVRLAGMPLARAARSGWEGTKQWSSEFAEAGIVCRLVDEQTARVEVSLVWPPDRQVGRDATLTVDRNDLQRWASAVAALARVSRKPRLRR